MSKLKDIDAISECLVENPEKELDTVRTKMNTNLSQLWIPEIQNQTSAKRNKQTTLPSSQYQRVPYFGTGKLPLTTKTVTFLCPQDRHHYFPNSGQWNPKQVSHVNCPKKKDQLRDQFQKKC